MNGLAPGCVSFSRAWSCTREVAYATRHARVTRGLVALRRSSLELTRGGESIGAPTEGDFASTGVTSALCSMSARSYGL
jgi:hypothetical protein